MLSQTEQFRLPDVGEGLTEATIVTWRVQAGDRVERGDPIVEIETSKSLVELPSPFTGMVTELLVPEGDTVPVGTPLLSVSSTDTASSVLVGYGPPQSTGPRRRRRRPSTGPHPAPDRLETAVSPAARAKPPVRKLARDLGVDLAAISQTKADGIVSRDDVLAAANAAPGGTTAPNQTRIAATGVRRATADAVTSSAFTAPHVTEFLTVDVTRTMKLISRLTRAPEFSDAKVTPLLVVASAVLAAARRFPEINSSWDADTAEIVLHHDVNLGIAVSSDRGLLVPNIKRAQSMTLPQLATAITELTADARGGSLTPERFADGTITITNIGTFGVDAGTPILNPGEAAILCLGAIRRRPWEHHGEIALRWTTQLALSFDHRIVDGELGSRVLTHVGKVLTDPRWELLLG